MTVCCYETAGYYTVRCMKWLMAFPLQQQETQLKQNHFVPGKGSSQESVESDQPRTNRINPLRMKLNLLYLQIQFVPCSKHTPPRL